MRLVCFYFLFSGEGWVLEVLNYLWISPLSKLRWTTGFGTLVWSGFSRQRWGGISLQTRFCLQTGLNALSSNGQARYQFQKKCLGAAFAFWKVWNTSLLAARGGHWILKNEDVFKTGRHHQRPLHGSLCSSHLLSWLCKSPRLSESSTKYTEE